MDSESSPLPRPTPPPPDLTSGPPPAPIPPPSPPAPPPAATEPGAALKPVKIAKGSGGDEDEEPKPGSEAPFNSRVIGGAIDSCVCLGIYVVFWILPDFLGFIGSLASTAYFLTRDSLPFLQGQSIGKKAMRIKAVTLDGQSLAGNWRAGIVRNVFMLIWPVELFILWSRNEKGGAMRRLGDDYAKTKVIVVAEEDALPVPVEKAAEEG